MALCNFIPVLTALLIVAMPRHVNQCLYIIYNKNRYL